MNSIIPLKSINSTIKEKVKIKQHIRTENGRVENVKQHMALRKVNPNKKEENIQSISLEDFNKKLDELNRSNTTGNKLLEIYRSGIHTIHDSGMEKNNQEEIPDVYENMVNGVAIDKEYQESSYEDMFGQYAAKKILKNKRFVSEISDRVDFIENAFKKHFGVNTERLTPFTFRFEHGIDIKYESHRGAVGNGILDILVRSNLVPKEMESDRLEKGFVGGNSMILNKFDSALSGENVNQKLLSQLFFPCNVMLNITHYKKPNLLDKYKLEKLEQKDRESILSFYMKNKTQTDGEIIRKKIKELISNNPNLKQYKTLTDTIKQLNPNQLPCFVAYMGLNIDGFIPNKEMMNEIYNPLNKLASALISKATHFKKTSLGGKYFYVSKNPFELLTMSPSGNFESCQSISESFEGQLQVGPYNANVLNSLYTNSNNDFIMFTTSKTRNGLEKSARTSFNYNPDIQNFDSYEQNKVYGSSPANIDIIKEFIHNNSHRFNNQQTSAFSTLGSVVAQKITDEVVPQILRSKIEPISKIREDINEQINDKNVSEFKQSIFFVNDLIKSYDIDEFDMEEMVGSVREHQQDHINDLLHEGNQSLLYQSEMHKLIMYGGGFHRPRIEDDIKFTMNKERNDLIQLRDNAVKKQKDRFIQDKKKKMIDSILFYCFDMLISEERRVRQHLRNINGKVSNVKEYMASKKVNPDKEESHIFSQKFSEYEKQYKDIISKMESKNEITPKDVLALYTVGPHAIHDEGLEINGQRINESYDKYVKTFGEEREDFFKKILLQDVVKKRIVDPKYLSNIEQKVNIIENFYNKQLDIDTERLTPFTFRFEHNIKPEYETDGVQVHKSVRNILSNIFKSENELQTFGGQISMQIRRDVGIEDDYINSIIKDNKREFNHFMNKELPKKLFVSGGKPFLFITYFELQHLSKSKHNISEFNNFKSSFKDQEHADDEMIRKVFIKNFPELKNMIKDMKPQQVKPFIDFAISNQVFPNKRIMEKFYDPICKLTKDIKSQAEQQIKKSEDTMYMYVSKNPMELLTMSPSGSFESCQSLTERNGVDSVSSTNINLINAAYGDNNFDYITYIAKHSNIGLKKLARASLNLDPTNGMNTYEYGKVYGSDVSLKKVLVNWISKYKDVEKLKEKQTSFELSSNIRDAVNSSIYAMSNKIIENIDDVWNNAEKSFKEKDINNFLKYRDQLVDIRLQMKTEKKDNIRNKISDYAKNVQKTEMMKIISSDHESMLYSGPVYNLFFEDMFGLEGGGIDGYHISNIVKEEIDNIDKRIGRIVRDLDRKYDSEFSKK